MDVKNLDNIQGNYWQCETKYWPQDGGVAALAAEVVG